ncbi:MAG: RHS repeat-associated core domain-containing protein [Candidatus Izemoplasmataceae bacterium]
MDIRTGKNNGSCSGTSSTTYTLGGDRVLVEERSDGTILYFTYDYDGSLLSMNYNGDEYFYITNLQGDIIELVDINGVSVAKYTYDAWGNITTQTGSIADINPYRYRGYRWDEETGYYYLNSRYYNPQIGRFINLDALSFLDTSGHLGSNGYTYTFNNPIRYDDSAGTFINTAIGAVVGGIWGGISAAAKGENVWAGVGYGAATGALAGFVVDLALATGGVGGVAIAAGFGFGVGFGTDVGQQMLFEGRNWEQVNKKRALVTGGITALVTTATFGLGKVYNSTQSTKLTGGFFKKMVGSIKDAKVDAYIFGYTTGQSLGGFPILPALIDGKD